ncbi:macrolide 2'-phosphotransferase [Alkalicoccobacillus gibsonii]|uniref:Macrolide 2'-phosphotransferase n=1 Tax=Alkalicoccobacillus gibsonii TaxID=79881 RepID=A0ABU9VM32_9BACI
MNTQKLKQLAAKEGLNISESSIKLNESGVDFQVAYATDQQGDQWILRLPRRPESMRHAAIEKNALEIIQSQASFEVPHWQIFSDELIAYKQLKGQPAATIDLEKQQYKWIFNETNVPTAYYQSLGKALANLHAIPQDSFHKIGVDTLHPSELRATMKKRMDRVNSQYEIKTARWERWQAWLADDSIWPSHVGVKHGDLHPGHLIVNKKNEVKGIIDWTEVGVGDTSVDFLSHQLLFGKEGLAKLIDAYDNAGGRTWSRMEEHIVELLTTSGITVAEYAEVADLQEMRETARVMLTE